MEYQESINVLATKHTFKKYCIVFIGILVFDIAFCIYILSTTRDVMILYIFLPVSFTFMLIFYFKLYIIARKYYLNYSLSISDESISVNNVEIKFDCINSITERVDGDLIVNTNSLSIVINSKIKDFSSIKNRLLSIKVIEKENQNTYKIISVFAILLMPLFLFIKIPFLVIPLGILLAGFYIYNTFMLFKEKVNIVMLITQIVIIIFIIVKTANYFIYIIK